MRHSCLRYINTAFEYFDMPKPENIKAAYYKAIEAHNEFESIVKSSEEQAKKLYEQSKGSDNIITDTENFITKIKNKIMDND